MTSHRNRTPAILEIHGGLLVLANHTIPVAQIRSVTLDKSEPSRNIIWTAALMTIICTVIWLPAPISNPVPGFYAAACGALWAYKVRFRRPTVWHLYATTGLVPKEVLRSEDKQTIRTAKSQLEDALS